MDFLYMIVLIFIIKIVITFIYQDLEKLREVGRTERIRLSTIPTESNDVYISIKDMLGTYMITINEIKSPGLICFKSVESLKNGGYTSYLLTYSSPVQSRMVKFTMLRGFHQENVLCRVEKDKLYFYYTPYPQNDTKEFRFYNITFNKM
jgi:hypothetical protein